MAAQAAGRPVWLSAPLIFGTALSVWGLGALYVTAGIGALATRALQAIKRA
ncbi:hypothetical protein [uncultured Paracoccus sp.]|uniref:hypothetical protein n=1 Tax=uncultured Paracoccus sp. TaxID=189685 RepID=UPI0025FC3AC4|nr:hypothetical protein [uncultured Paracoccus sp.]